MAAKQALIIDDNPTNVQILETLLKKQGLTYVSVLGAQRLDTTLKSITALDIVFLDLEMPGLNGFDVLAILKESERFQGVPVVAYTVHVSQFQETLLAGFHSFIAKPIDPKRFPGQLARILAGERVWDRN